MTGKSDPYGWPVAGSGRAAAAAEQVGGDDEEAIGVERLARANHAIPPPQSLPARAVAIFRGKSISRALGRRRSRKAGGVRVAAQRVAHKDDVVPRRSKGAVGFVGDTDRMQLPAAVESKRRGQVQELRFNRADRAGGGPGR
jgi:hypothetical protein